MLKDNRMNGIYTAVRTLPTGGVCDVGTDHAHIPIELVKNGKVSFAIATDISLPSIQKGEKNIRKLGLSDKIKTYCANGTSGVPLDGISDIIIAGMGGELISEILFADERLKNSSLHFILQPMTKHSELRELLAKNGFSIEKESCISDGDRIYFIMSVYYTGEAHTLTLRDLLLGVNTEKNKTLLDYTARLKVQLSAKLSGMMSASVLSAEDIEAIKDRLAVLDEFAKE